jgi:hypothetical protein
MVFSTEQHNEMLQPDQTFPWKVGNYKIYIPNVIHDTVQRLFFSEEISVPLSPSLSWKLLE